MRHPLLPALALAVASALAAPVAAQDRFYATLNGNNEVPPVPTNAVGRGWFNFDLPSQRIFYRVESNVAFGTAAHIHQGAPGVNGPVVFPLAGGPQIYEGATPVLTAAQVQNLYNGNFYVNVHTAVWPGGEIRGQLTKSITRTTQGNLTGTQEVPPTPSVGGGAARVVLSTPSNVITYRVSASGLTGPPTAAHIHQAPAGVNGPVIVPLNGGGAAPPFEWCGSATLTAAQVTALLANGCYVNIHTAAFPGGEIRAQLIVQKEEFATNPVGTEEVPPNASPNTGFSAFVYDPVTSMVSYNQSWSGVGGTASHVHMGVPTVSGAIVYALAGPANGPWAGLSAALPAATVSDMFNVKHYANIHSAAFPGGEIRGQLRQNPNIFGWPGVTTAGPLGRVLKIGASGAPSMGSTWVATVTDAIPGGFVSLAYAEDTAGMPLDLAILGFPGEYLFVNILAGYSTGADALGCAEIVFTVPVVPALVGTDYFFQWVGIEGPNLVVSDAMQVWVR